MAMTLNDEDSVVDIDEQVATRVALAVHEIVEYIIEYATSADATNVDTQVGRLCSSPVGMFAAAAPVATVTNRPSRVRLSQSN